MTQTIIFMRHAEYSRSFGENAGRLTNNGIQMAKDMAMKLKDFGLNPDTCIFSNAIRAIQTKDIILETAGFSPTHVLEEKSINECWDFDPMADAVNLFPDAKCVLIVGHNPIMGALGSMIGRHKGIFTPGSFLVVEYSAKINSRNICNSAEAKVIYEEIAVY